MQAPIENIGQEIRRLRLRRGWSQVRLSREAQAASVSMIERGERLNPSLSQIHAIARALGVTIDKILDGAARMGRKKHG